MDVRPSVGAFNRENFHSVGSDSEHGSFSALILGQVPNLVRPVRAALQHFKNVHQEIARRAMWYRRLCSHLPAA